MSNLQTLADRMRSDWNQRALEDARYFVAFGRRQQDDAEFVATASEVLTRIGWEFARLPLDTPPSQRRFLEIGCGIGRLLGPLSEMCGEIHGVDISDEMVRLGRQRLANNSTCHLHWTPNSDLSAFADATFDFVYSYAVMQHLPDEGFFWLYLSEGSRVLRPNGILLLQFNSERAIRDSPDTWAGVRLEEGLVVARCAGLGLRVLALEGRGTQYTWLTAARAQIAKPNTPLERFPVLQVTGASGEEHLTAGGPRGFAEMFVAQLPCEYCDLCCLAGLLGDLPLDVVRTGCLDAGGSRQITLQLPESAPLGEQWLSLTWRGVPVTTPRRVIVEPFLRGSPQVLGVTDGINLLDACKISCGVAKVWIQNLSEPQLLHACIGRRRVDDMNFHREDEIDQRYQVNLRVPTGLPLGPQTLEISAGASLVYTGLIEHRPRPIERDKSENSRFL